MKFKILNTANMILSMEGKGKAKRNKQDVERCCKMSNPINEQLSLSF